MNSLFGTFVVLASTLNAPQAMQPRVLMGDSSHCVAIMVRNGHLSDEYVCAHTKSAQPREVSWDGADAVITDFDEKASRDWIRSHSILSRLSLWKGDLYWDGKRVDLGKTDVSKLYEAIPWQGGVLIYGSTTPRRHFWQEWPFDPSTLTRDMEPYCAIYFDLKTLKGEDLWINGKVYLGLFVYPIPK